jgi:hypothetical protein
MQTILLILSCAVLLHSVSAKYTDIPKASETKILSVLFKLLHVDADASQCVSDSTGAANHFRDFAEDYKTKSYEQAIAALSSGFSALSSSISDCGIPQVQHAFDAMALATKFAKISAKLGKLDSIIVGASELVHDVESIATAAASGDSTQIGNSIGTFLNDWSQVTGGCGDHKGCALVGGLLRIIQEVATDIKPCEAALAPAVTKFEAAEASWDAKDYKAAVASMAASLDVLATALKQESCGVPRIATLIGNLSPKLQKAVVKVEDSGAVKILVESADIYDDVYRMVQAIKTKDFTTVGMELGNLLRVLRASGCSTKACTVLEGLMASMQLELESFDSCMKDADRAWDNLAYAQQDFKNKNYKGGVQQLGHGVVALADSIKDCNIPQVAQVAENMFTKLNDNAAANMIGEVVQVLVNGADITLDLNSAVLDFGGKNWAGFGADLGNLAQAISSTKCNSVACKIVEGLLNAAGTAFQNLEACENDLKKAVAGFTEGAQSFQKKDYRDGLKNWAKALNTVSTAVSACGISQELSYMEQEANVMGLANVTAVAGFERDVSILIHGSEFYSHFFQTLVDFKQHDYRSVGNDLQTVMADLSSWTGKHACESDFCYVVVGVLQFLGGFNKGSIKECQNDFKTAYADFKQSAHDFGDAKEKPVIFHFKHDKAAIKKGTYNLGAGVKEIAKGVKDCHLEAFAELLEKLAVKLGIAPEVSWLEELLHIVINGVKIENEVGNALEDWSSKNWPGFGYNVAKLTETLL